MSEESKNSGRMIDRNPPLENEVDIAKKIVDYLAYLKDQLNFMFQNFVVRKATSTFLRDNGFETRMLAGNAYYLYSSSGTTTITLSSDHTYLVTYCRRNSTITSDDAAWIVSSHQNNSHLVTLVSSSSTTASVSGLTLTITRGSAYGRISLTRLA